MWRAIPVNTIKLMRRLRNERFPIPEIAKRVNVSYMSAWFYTKAEERQIKSYTEYQNYLLKKRGFASRANYCSYLSRQKAACEQLAKEKGFKSYADYSERLAEELSDLIQNSLIKIHKDQSWLAEQMGVTRQAVSLYVQRKSIPNQELLVKLYSALRVKYKTIDDLL